MWLTTCIELIFIKYLGVDIYQIVVSYENDLVSVNHVCKFGNNAAGDQ